MREFKDLSEVKPYFDKMTNNGVVSVDNALAVIKRRLGDHYIIIDGHDWPHGRWPLAVTEGFVDYRTAMALLEIRGRQTKIVVDCKLADEIANYVLN